jgi:hypothetical protein
MKKSIVIETLNSFEDEFDIEKFIERLFFVEKIEKGLNDIQEGRIRDNYKGWAFDRAPGLIHQYAEAIKAVDDYKYEAVA